MRIAYCLNSISYVGGIEKITSAKANALSDIPGNEVYVIVTDCPEGVAVASDRLSPKVRLVDLAVGYYADDWKSRYHVLKGIFVKRRLHKKRLRSVLYEIRPDVVISVGLSEKYILPEIKGDWVTVREFHFRKDFRLLTDGTPIDKLMAVLNNFYDYRCKIRHYDHIVTLTHEDRERNWKNCKNISVIPNMLTFPRSDSLPMENKKVIAVGRLVGVKNFWSLIHAFRTVADHHPDWSLDICGDGPEREILQMLIYELRLENNVFLCGHAVHVRDKMRGASLFVLSSLFEGMPLVMLEAMSCGLPVVSYDCPCGPKDIITDGEDGLLVSAGDERMLAEKICWLIENPDQRLKMGAAALKKADNYRPEKIVPMWQNLFDRLLAEKRGKC